MNLRELLMNHTRTHTHNYVTDCMDITSVPHYTGGGRKKARVGTAVSRCVTNELSGHVNFLELFERTHEICYYTTYVPLRVMTASFQLKVIKLLHLISIRYHMKYTQN